ncbi:MAG: MMPL family transporter, partial [Clostridiales bacterium]|nr:MMPL family transporter [Clostridiales bacterium]
MKQNNDDNFFVKLSTVIVDKKGIILLLYIAAFAFSMVSQGWVNVCNDITEYLPDSTETRRGLTIMNDEFITYAASKAMVINITYDEAENIADRIRSVEGVSIVDFDDTEDHYKDGCALYDITLDSEGGDEKTTGTYEAIRSLLSEYDVYISESDSDDSKALDAEMNTVLLVAAVIIVSVLLFTSRTYMEVPVLILTFIGAAVLNKGTNYLLGEISFVSNSVTAILQLALSIDYAIIMIHHYSEERQFNDRRGAVIYALAKSIPEISSSCLTTVSGLLAMMFMHFKIGFDLGLSLIKSIGFSLLAVFTLMPCLLMLFGKYIDKTPHKNHVPDISGLGSIVYKLRMVVPPIFVGIIVAGYFLSSNCPYVYDLNSSGTDRKNEAQIAKEMIESEFGSDNIAAIIVPAGDYAKEKELIAELEKHDEIGSITGLSNVEAKDGYVLTDSLTPRQFAELTNIDIELSKTLYAVYAAEHKEYSRLAGNLDDTGVPLIDMFMFLYDMKEDGYVSFEGEPAEELDDLYVQ